ncbi:unnamed protein product [Timema podura]|uniref:Uncharacterized protein n=1 Tax=Timema podura TaxID=61482 RepID=A0ABN7P271_TIMPD|nr:unnamed protein product [Timema podura]
MTTSKVSEPSVIRYRIVHPSISFVNISEDKGLKVKEKLESMFKQLVLEDRKQDSEEDEVIKETQSVTILYKLLEPKLSMVKVPEFPGMEKEPLQKKKKRHKIPKRVKEERKESTGENIGQYFSGRSSGSIRGDVGDTIS